MLITSSVEGVQRCKRLLWCLVVMLDRWDVSVYVEYQWDIKRIWLMMSSLMSVLNIVWPNACTSSEIPNWSEEMLLTSSMFRLSYLSSSSEDFILMIERVKSGLLTSVCTTDKLYGDIWCFIDCFVVLWLFHLSTRGSCSSFSHSGRRERSSLAWWATPELHLCPVWFVLFFFLLTSTLYTLILLVTDYVLSLCYIF